MQYVNKMEQNKHIDEYLKFYIENRNPGYAVMLTGRWGTGKTWYIKKFIESNSEANKFLYVPLFGLSNVREIEEKIFKLLHPIWGSQAFKTAANLLGAVLRVNINDVNLNLSLKKLDKLSTKKFSYLKKLEKYILVFDDLERFQGSLSELLGYLNYLVEHSEFRVILVSNEDKILEQNNEYKKFKEKVIGKTFLVTSDIDTALKEFLKSLEHKGDTQKSLSEHINLIKQIFKLSQYENLRILKQAIKEFDNIFKFLPNEARGKRDLIKEVISYYFIYFLEIQSGTISYQEIKEFRFAGFFNKNNEKTIYEQISSKYWELVSFWGQIANSQIWNDFFKYGVVEQKIVEEAIFKTYYFMKQEKTDLEKLQNLWELTDVECIRLFKKVLNDLRERRLEDVKSVFAAFDLLYFFIDKKICNIKLTKDELLNQAKENINELYLKNKIEIKPNDSFEHFICPFYREGYSGKSEELRALCDFLLDIERKIKKVKLKEKSTELLNLMNEDLDKFHKLLTQTYYEMPILIYIAPEDFFSKWLQLDGRTKDLVIYSLEERRKLIVSDVEKDWYKKLKYKMEEYVSQNSHKLSGFHIRNILDRRLRSI